MRRRRSRLSRDPITVTVESISHEGRGIATVDGRKVFIGGALPGETVTFTYRKKNARFAEGNLVDILDPSPVRVQPGCRHYTICGGCSMQHLSRGDQLAHKQQVLLEQFRHIGAVEPQTILPPLSGSEWGYRRKARIGLKYVLKKGRLLIGFREKGSGKLADLQSCEVLHPAFGQHLLDLQSLVQSLDCYDRIPQIELAVGEENHAIIIRHLAPLEAEDRLRLQQFQQMSGISVLLQAGGPDTVTTLNDSSQCLLRYRISKFDLDIQFAPGDFTQVNFELNDLMIDRAIELLVPDKEDTVLDLFCGIGNFTLPLALHANNVTGIEGDAALIERARNNAVLNDIHNAQFQACDLTEELPQLRSDMLNFNKVLMDPSRSGAREIIEQLDFRNTEKLVYVSCNPATLARDSGILVKDKGFLLKMAGIMDMFPQTSHVESIALFEKP